VAPVLVVFVKATDRTLFDRTSWTAIGVLPRLLPLVLGRRVWAEVAITSGRRTTAVRPWRPPARARRIIPATATAARRSCSARSVTTGTRTWGASGALFARPCLADRKRTSLEELLIESADRGFRNRTIGVIDEREAAGPTGFTIDRKNNLCGFTD